MLKVALNFCGSKVISCKVRTTHWREQLCYNQLDNKSSHNYFTTFLN